MTTLGMDYFDQLYATSADPWGFATRWYEACKYALSLALMPAERYRDAFEPGCSVGVLTELLAPRCDRVLSCDGAGAAVREAAARTAQLPNVRVARGHPR
jgi:trans-aconitate methyltransferase